MSSTGVIGVVLPDGMIRAALPEAHARLSASGVDAASRAILTTDVGPKVARATFTWKGRRGSVVGIAKGAGMIHPNMATMLAFVMTDAPATPACLKAVLARRGPELPRDLRRRGHLDERHGAPPGVRGDGRAGDAAARHAGALRAAVTAVCRKLAWLMVRDGEGATRVLDVSITGARTEADAKAAAHAVATSPLVKTALNGGDPNWGRILAAVGRSGARFDASARVADRLGRLVLVDRGLPVAYREKDAAKVFARERVPVAVDLGAGRASAFKLASDLGHAYVSCNADYRS